MKFLTSGRFVAVVVGAAIIALLGTSAAVGHGLVGSQDIKNQSIQSWDIARDGVGFSEIREGSVGWHNELNKFTRNKIRNMVKEGPQGPAGVSGYEAIGRNTDAQSVAPGAKATIETLCASEDSSPEQQAEMALGGGAKSGGDVTVLESYPSSIEQFSEPDEDDPAGRWGAAGWTVEVVNHGDAPASVQPFVVCALVN